MSDQEPIGTGQPLGDPSLSNSPAGSTATLTDQTADHASRLERIESWLKEHADTVEQLTQVGAEIAEKNNAQGIGEAFRLMGRAIHGWFN